MQDSSPPSAGSSSEKYFSPSRTVLKKKSQHDEPSGLYNSYSCIKPAVKMDSANYLMSYGWSHGQPLQKGGLRKPILVKHKKDTKGLGHNAGDQEAWWERMFDGQLKSLDVTGGSSVSFKQREVKMSAVSQNVSPLYRMFVRGGVLEGSIPPEGINSANESKRKRGSDEDETEVEQKQVKKEKKEKKESKKSSKTKKRKSRSNSPDGNKSKKSKDKTRSGTTPDEGKKSSKPKTYLQHEEDWIRKLIQTSTQPEAVLA